MLGAGHMTTPALAHILTRLITREGWQGLYLRPNFKKGWIAPQSCMYAASAMRCIS